MSDSPAEGAPGAPEELPQRTFRTQVLYRVAGHLHFSCHESDDVTLALIRRRRDLYFFSSCIPEVPPRRSAPPPSVCGAMRSGERVGGMPLRKIMMPLRKICASVAKEEAAKEVP